MDTNTGEYTNIHGSTGKDDANEDQLAKLEQAIGVESPYFSGNIAAAVGASSVRKDSLQCSVQVMIDDVQGSFFCSGPLGGECASGDSR